MNKKTISIIGGGIGGLATAVLMAKDGHKVSVYEKNECLGGRASIFSANDYTFDMGPSRYLMPDLFEKFFHEIGEDIHEHLNLTQLSPSYKVFYPNSRDDLLERPNDIGSSKKQQEREKNNSKKSLFETITLASLDEYSEQVAELYEECFCNDSFGKLYTKEYCLAHYQERSQERDFFGKALLVANEFAGFCRGSGHHDDVYIYEILDKAYIDTLFHNQAIDKDKVYWFDDACLCKDYRGKGYFKQLFSNLQEYAQSQGYTNLFLYTVANDNYLIELYQKYGFSILDTFTNKLSQTEYIIMNKGIGKDNTHTKNTSLQSLNVYADIERMANIFEEMEHGSGQKFRDFLKRSAEQYHIGMEFALKNYDSIFDFFKRDIALKGMKLNIWTTIDKYVARFFTTPIIQKIMQYTTVFLGTAPNQTPAFYNIMSHVDFAMGVRYPQGGLHAVAQALVKIGKKYGVQYHTDSEVVSVQSEEGQVKSMTLKDGKNISSDLFIVNADQARFETEMIAPKYQTYPKPFWDKKTFAPSGFIIYAGISKKLDNLEHHNLYFDDNRAESFGAIYDRHVLADDPSIYICAPSKTDPDVAPVGKENLFILVPITNGITISQEEKQVYRDKIWKIVEDMAGEKIVPYIEYEQIFEIQDFKDRYHAYKGTALGLGHTMMQTASFRPNNYSKKLDNLFYVGHNTNPGIGVPMVIVSAMLVKERINEKMRH